jgi:hypothetical protein
VSDGSGPSERCEDQEKANLERKKGENVQVEDPLVLELTPTCQALVWAADFVERPSGVLERAGLGTNGDGTMFVP